ncbi:hypothetical protein QVD17_33866 [Tagetes erecta]|uniref:Sodium/hydrogen exchanger n=1 Tax=Tagetes erecta TaxID=13708 RepID=A0AAD8NLB5_TARER|nr:hypothetical protein QVD17_33866 [Tagetes erecta]
MTIVTKLHSNSVPTCYDHRGEISACSMDYLSWLLAKLVPVASDPEAEFVRQITLFALLLCACIIVGHLLENNTRWMNQSITALLVGLGIGCFILITSHGKSSHILEFKQEFFFIYLLPPIIFNAGFQVKKKQFFRNFLTITSYGVFGTLLSFAIISFGASRLFPMLDFGYLEIKDYLALGAIFSATDSVCTLQVLNQDETPLLYSLVFGEGVVNDATSVVLFNAISNFDLSDMNYYTALDFAINFFKLFMLSTFLGVCVGLLCALIIRLLKLGSSGQSTDHEVALMMLMAYLSYITADMFALSGILAVFFCGIAMSHYAWHNVTDNSQVTTKHSFATMSFIAEVFIFLYVGMDSLDVAKWRFIEDSPGKSIWVSIILLVLIMIGRAAFLIPLSCLSNLTRRDSNERIGFKQQFIVWWAGIMRGAVSIALAYKKFTGSGQTIQPANALLITSTITVVLFSTIVFGLLTKPLIKALLPESSYREPCSPTSSMIPLLEDGHDDDPETGNHRTLRSRPSLKMLFRRPTTTVHYYWRKFDNGFMRPVFCGTGSASDANGTRDMDAVY